MKTVVAETFGPPNEHRRELYRSVVIFGDWIYAAIGAQPWHLVAFNFRTREGRLLAATDAIIGDPGTIRMTRMQGGLSGHIRNAASVTGIDDFDRGELAFWLHEGRIYRRVDDVPPWSDDPAQKDSGTRYDWAREFHQIVKELRPQALLGNYQCAWKDEDFWGARRRCLGLDFAALAEYVDVFSPMPYHGRSGMPPEWFLWGLCPRKTLSWS